MMNDELKAGRFHSSFIVPRSSFVFYEQRRPTFEATARTRDRRGGGRRRGRRRRHLPDARGDDEGGRLALLPARRLARGGRDGPVRRALLRRAGGAPARGGRRLRLPARRIRAAARLPLRLDGLARARPRTHRRARRRRGLIPRLRALALAGADEDFGRRLHRLARRRERARRAAGRTRRRLADGDEARAARLHRALGLRPAPGRLGQLQALRRAARRLSATLRRARGRVRLGLLLLRRLVGLEQARRRGARPRAHTPARLHLRAARRRLRLRADERGLRLPRPRRARHFRRGVRRAGALVFTGVVVVAVFGSLASFTMSAPRVYFAMARDRLFFKDVARLHPRYQTPARAIIIQAALASLLVLLGSFNEIIAYFFFAVVLFIALAVAALFVLRREGRPAGFRTPLYPVTPVVYLALTALLLFLLASQSPKQALAGVGVVALGLPFYYLLFRRRAASGVVEGKEPLT